ncbi:MAG: helix-turn-helix transcriptional regulator [Clostridia bacterium]|nr:helix-turn-helix transcriptional regulator [Clostridia bacterium]
MESYERLAQLRKEHGYTVEAIAEVLECSPISVRRWESGSTKMKFRKYIVLAKLYGVSLDYIAGLTDVAESQ